MKKNIESTLKQQVNKLNYISNAWIINDIMYMKKKKIFITFQLSFIFLISFLF